MLVESYILPPFQKYPTLTNLLKLAKYIIILIQQFLAYKGAVSHLLIKIWIDIFGDIPVTVITF